jgi:hypothetical protein
VNENDKITAYANSMVETEFTWQAEYARVLGPYKPGLASRLSSDQIEQTSILHSMLPLGGDIL